MLDIKGTFRVTKVRALKSNIQYQILFLKDKALFVKTGGQMADGGLGGILGGSLGGMIGAGIGTAIDAKVRKSLDKKIKDKVSSLVDMEETEIINLDKNNFAFPYEEIFKMKMKKSFMSLNGARTGVLVIEGKKKEIYDICVNQQYDECERIVHLILPDKIDQP